MDLRQTSGEICHSLRSVQSSKPQRIKSGRWTACFEPISGNRKPYHPVGRIAYRTTQKYQRRFIKHQTHFQFGDLCGGATLSFASLESIMPALRKGFLLFVGLTFLRSRRQLAAFQSEVSFWVGQNRGARRVEDSTSPKWVLPSVYSLRMS